MVTLPVSVRAALRIEGLVACAVAAALYQRAGMHGWVFFAALFLFPDLSMLAYLHGPRTAALSYNAFHTYSTPALLALLTLARPSPLLRDIAIIWVAHIGFDRLLGYGLKLPEGFQFTHLGPIGHRRDA